MLYFTVLFGIFCPCLTLVCRHSTSSIGRLKNVFQVASKDADIEVSEMVHVHNQENQSIQALATLFFVVIFRTNEYGYPLERRTDEKCSFSLG